MSRLALVTATLATLASGWGYKKSPPPATKPTEPAAAAPAAVAPVAAAARTLGPIDLGAARVDLPALFPGTTYLLHPAEDQIGGGSMPDGYAVDTAEIRRGEDLLLQAELDGTAVTQLLVFHPSLGTPAGVHVGDSAAQLARALPDATCEQTRLDVRCASAKEPGFVFSMGDAGLPGERGTAQPIAQVAPDAAIDHIAWSPAPGQRLTLAARPTTIAPAEAGADLGDEPGDGPGQARLTADEVQRCARMLRLASACGVDDDYEFGWIRVERKPIGAAEARAQCAAYTPSPDDVSWPPVKVFEPAQLARLEAAQKRSCKAMFALLDELDPRMTEAGGHPTEP